MNNLEKEILSKYPNWKGFLQAQSPEQLLVNYDFVNNFSDIYSTSPITLKFITELYKLPKSYAGFEYLEKWLHFLNDFLNINKGLQPGIIKQLSYMLYARYNHFRLSDMKLLFNHILDSRYGTFYGSIDTQRIVSSFYEYSNERKDAFLKIETKIAEEEKKKQRERPAGLPDFDRLPNLKKYFTGNGDKDLVNDLVESKKA